MNPAKFLLREVARPSFDDPALQAVDGDFDAFERAYNERTVVLGEGKWYKRLPVGFGHLYYGDGREPCHYCEQPVGKAHLDGCDHEACPACAEAGEDVQWLSCNRHESAEHEVTLSGRIGGKRARVVGVGFTEDEAQADATKRWLERQRKAYRDYIRDAGRKRDAALRVGLDNIAEQWERHIATAERRLGET